MLTDRYIDALSYTAPLHRGHTRKGTDIPYLSHLLAVSSMVMEQGGDEDQAIGALLHDAIEDIGPLHPGGPGALRREIASRFGAEVLAIVEACTDAETLPKPPWRARKEGYIAHLRSAPPAAMPVICADKLHNARAILRDYRAIGEVVWERFTGRKAGTLWYYRALAETLRSHPAASASLADELDRTVTALEKLAAAAG